MGAESAIGGSDVTGFSAPVLAGAAQSKEARAQALLVETDNNEKIKNNKKNNKKFVKQQELAFLKSGVILDGSPLMILKESVDEGAEDIMSMQRKSKNQTDSVRRSGRAALLSGFNQGINNAKENGMKMASMGAGGGMSGGGGLKAAPSKSMTYNYQPNSGGPTYG